MTLKNKFGKTAQNRIILTGIYIILVLLITRFKFAYGSSMDWCSQHYVFPDYFRRLFYKTGDFFPDFAANTGAGENIYNFSYYGLFSPVIVLSYLFPFIKMQVYIQVISIIEVWISVMIFYSFLKKRFSLFSAFSGSLALLFSSAYIFHSHRHIMFVSYMPFLILSLEAADKFIEKKLKTPLIACMTLMILCNYFFSIPALMSVSIYAVYSHLKNNREFRIKDFMSEGLNFTICVIISVMISAVLLLPSAAAIISGRGSQDIPFDFTLLIPRVIFSISVIFPQTIGMTVFGITAVVSAIIYGNKSGRFLGISIAVINIFPIFTYILNGGMYLDGKVYIPFIPLMIIIVTEKFEEYISGIQTGKSVFIISGIIITEGIIFYQTKYDYVKYVPLIILTVDLLIFSLFFTLYIKKRRKCFLVLSALLTSAAVTAFSGFFDFPMPLERIEYENSDEIKNMAHTIAEDDELVRSSLNAYKADTVNMVYDMDCLGYSVYSSVCSNYYKDFYFSTMRNENEYRNSALVTYSGNILFNIFMGNKYLITNKDCAETGYELIKQGKDFALYKNDFALPVGRSSDMIISEKYFDSLLPVEQMEAAVRYIITDDNEYPDRKCVFTNRKYTLPQLPETKNITRTGTGYKIKSGTELETDMILSEPLPEDKLLVIFMDIDNSMSDKDARIKINNMRNTLTSSSWKYRNGNNSFEYVLSANGNKSLDSLHFIFSPGEYKINNIECFTVDYPKNIRLTGEFRADKARTGGDFISGSINCEKDSFFEITIPYDTGFRITVDGKPQKYRRTDKAFIGFEISRGPHDIEIEYKAPLKKEGLIVSASGIILLITVAVYEYAKKLKKI